MELDKEINKVALIKLVADYKKQSPVSVILDCFDVKKSTYYRWKIAVKHVQKKNTIVEKIDQLCFEQHFIYGYRPITLLLKKNYGIIANHSRFTASHHEGKGLALSNKT